ncbi:S41 family peptidase [Bacillus sp. M6-12]|uniref:lmo1851 family serine protease n=1 Tax=Bacillus sp. M6-12 TaxID=2054166 RepID=UPI0035B54D04
MEEGTNQEEKKDSSKFIHIKRYQLLLLILLLVIVTAGITAIALTFKGESEESIVQRTNSDKPEFDKLFSTYETLTEQYYKEVDKDKLINGAINGMLDSLEDPYSDYMNEEEAKSFHENISSSFEGIGAEIQEQEGKIVIVSPIKGSPAEKAGLQPKDIILSVNGKSLQGMSSTEAVLLIRGKKGSKVELEILRGDSAEPIKVQLTRDTIPLETVYAEMLKDGIAKVQITSFSENTARELRTALNDMASKEMKGLILDVRGNPGGLLDQAEQIASMFVPRGEVIFQVEDRNGEKAVFKSKGNGELDVPVVVLVDKGSASASEILAAAVKESAGIKLIGEKTFGKGTVQSAKDFNDKSNFKFTTAKWLTPDGNWIHKKGIKPDVEVALPQYAQLAFISPDKELKESDSSAEVKTAEEMLEVLGFSPGKVDGFFDSETKKAVQAFQTSKKLETTGVVKGKTTLQLMEGLRDKILNNDTQLKKAQELLGKEIAK